MSRPLRVERGGGPATMTCPKLSDRLHLLIQSQEVGRLCLEPEPWFRLIWWCAVWPYLDLLRLIAMSFDVGHRSGLNVCVRSPTLCERDFALYG